MTLPINTEDYGYRFYKHLNEDVKLKSDEYGRWDIDFNYEQEDWVNVTGFNSITNACIIAIMTRYTELGFMDLYDEFGCRVHELIKHNKTKNIIYKMEVFITETLKSMRRVNKVNWVTVTDTPNNEYYNYRVNFSISCINDGEEENGQIITEEFLI